MESSCRDRVPSTPHQSAAASNAAPSSGVILIVDDEATVCETLGKVLSRAGYQTLTAKSSAEALATLGRSLPDLILLDIAMPLMDGLSLLRLMRQNSAFGHVPVIMLTRASEKASVVAAARLGVKGYILKAALKPQEMLAQIQQVIAESRPAAQTSAQSTPAPSVSGASAAEQPASPAPLSALAPLAAAAQAPVITEDTQSAALTALRSTQPVMSLADVMKAIEKCDEPKGFSPAVSEVLTLTASPQCSTETVAKAISRDPAMALKILRLANSTVYNRGEPVSSVLRAVLRIGLGQIRQIAMNMAVIDHFPAESIGDSLDVNQFWEHAIATGIVASEIARASSEKEADAAFTMGVLHDVGRLALVQKLPEEYGAVLKTARSQQLPLEEAERAMLCCTHADIMNAMLLRWKFAKEFAQPIVSHHQPPRLIAESPLQSRAQAVTLALADRLAHAFMLGSSGNETIYPTEELCEALQLQPATMERIEKVAREETDKVKFALLALSNGASWTQQRDTYRRRLFQPFKPLYLSQHSAFDACRVFCSQLADLADEKPNVAIMHIRTSQELAGLNARLLEKEQQWELQPLPLLAISPVKTIAAELGVCQGRRIAVLATPFVIERFISAIDSLLESAEEAPAKAPQAAAAKAA